MAEIEDSGKVWLKGASSPIHAVRVGDKIFPTGKREDQKIELWLEGVGLCVDLHDVKKGERVVRYFPLDLPATLPGTLFNGFTNTRHADVLIVDSSNRSVKTKSVTGGAYQSGDFTSMDSQTFWKMIWKE